MRAAKIIAVLCGSLFLYVVATVLGVAILYFMAATVLGTVAASYGLARLSLRAVVGTCRALAAAHEGATVSLPLRLENRSKLPRFLLSVRPDLPEGLECVSAEAELFCPVLTAGESWETCLRVKLNRRGVYQLASARVAARDPLDLFGSSVSVPITARVFVYPRLVSLARVPLVAVHERSSSDGGAAIRSSAGDEFHAVREYVPGDDLRRIHWKSTARTLRFHVVDYEEPVDRSLFVLLDDSAGSDAGRGADTTFESACRAAASLLAYAAGHGIAARLVIPSLEGFAGLRPPGSDWFRLALTDLAYATPTREEPLDAWVRRFQADLQGELQCVVLSSTLSDRLPEAVRLLRGPRREVRVVLFDAADFAPESPAPAASALLTELVAHGADVVVAGREDDLGVCLREVTSVPAWA